MTDWTIVLTERLAVLWRDGLSAREIGNELGFSRNAVIGKAHRMHSSHNLENRKPRVRSIRPTSLTDAVRKAPRRPYLRPAGNGPPPTEFGVVPDTWRTTSMSSQTEAPTPKMLSTFDLADKHCRWPVGDPGKSDFGFCGHDKKEGSVYCAYHHRIAYAPKNRATPAVIWRARLSLI